jgi:hypothetical protein
MVVCNVDRFLDEVIETILRQTFKEFGGILCQETMPDRPHHRRVFQTEVVLLGWRLGFRVDESPVDISELRPSPVKVLRRVPKVLNTILELKRSLSCFPAQSSRLDLATASAADSAVAGDIQQTES